MITVALGVLSGCGGAPRAAAPTAGGLVAFSTEDGHIALSNANGGHVRYVARGAVLGISPDGRTLAIARATHVLTGSRLLLLHLDTGATTQLAGNAFPPVVWSPDSGRLLFTQRRSSRESLVLCDRSPARCHTIAPNLDFGYAFSPDGRRIAFSSSGSSSNDFEPSVRVVSTSGRRLLKLPFHEVWLWAPAGLMLGRVPNGHPQTVWLRKDDGTTRILFSGRGDMPLMVPRDVSPDGSTVLYDALVGCGPVVPKPNQATGWVCASPEAVMEAGPVSGGLPHPVSSYYSRPYSGRFSPDGTAVIAAFEGPPGRRRVTPATRFYLGVQPLAPPAGSPRPTPPQLFQPLLDYSGSPSIAR